MAECIILTQNPHSGVVRAIFEGHSHEVMRFADRQAAEHWAIEAAAWLKIWPYQIVDLEMMKA